MSTTEITKYRAFVRSQVRKLWPARSKPAKRELIRVCIQAPQSPPRAGLFFFGYPCSTSGTIVDPAPSWRLP